MVVGLLGPVEVDGARPLGPRERAVVAVLALERGRSVAVDRIADALWGETPPPSWAKQVQICVARIRRSLGAEAVETTGSGYRLTLSPDAVDAGRFEDLLRQARLLREQEDADRAVVALERALRLWRGAPLAELDGWPPARTEAARLLELRRVAEEDLLDARLAAGDHRSVVGEAQVQVDEEPLRERRWGLLALAQYRSGHQSAALATLRRARAVLAERVGVDPGRDLVGLEAALLRQDPGLDAVPEPVPVSALCPWKGLAPYTSDDRDVFFGREDDVRECRRRLAESRLLVVAGPSGCGKSSLVRAGVLPALASGLERTEVLLPGEEAASRVGELRAGIGHVPAVLVVDQFEEFFGLGLPGPVVDDVCRDLVRVAADGVPVVVTLRSDHLGSLGAVDTEVSRAVERGLLLLGPPSVAALRSAIESPAHAAGLRLEPGLTDLLLADAEGEAGALPLLSHALAETWRIREGHVLTIEGYRTTGGIRGAVARSADRLYDTLPESERATLRAVLLRLVVPSPDGDPVRYRVSQRVLADGPERARVVALLVRHRLLITDESTVEVAHEALARAWPRLRTWLEEDAAGQRLHRQLSVAAEGWDALGRPESELARGARLRSTLEWRDERRPDLGATEVAYLDASVRLAAREEEQAADRARRDARRVRQLRGLLAVTTGLLVIALVAGAAAVAGRHDAGVQRDAAFAASTGARVEALVSRSLAERGGDRSLGALLAVEAWRLRPDARSHAALMGTFTAAGGYLGHHRLPARESDGVLAGDGAVVLLDGKELALLDLDTGVLDRRFDPVEGQGVALLATSGDGRLVARTSRPWDVSTCADACGVVSVHDIETGATVFGPLDLPEAPSGVALDEAGSVLVVVGGSDGAVTWWDTRRDDGEPLGSLPGMPPGDEVSPARFDGRSSTGAVAFLPDGRLVSSGAAGVLRAVDPHDDGSPTALEVPGLHAQSWLLPLPDGRRLLSAGTQGLVLVDTLDWRVVWSVDTRAGQHPENCPWPAIDPARDGVWCGSYYGVLAERDLADGGLTGRTLDMGFGSVGSLAVVAEGDELVAFGADSPVVSRWRLDGSGLVQRVVAPGYVDADGFDSSGDYLLVAPRPADAVAWDDFHDFAVWDLRADAPHAWFRDVAGAGWAGKGTVTGLELDRMEIAHWSLDGTLRTRGAVSLESLAAWPSAGGTRSYVMMPGGDVWALDVATLEPTGPVLTGEGDPVAVSATADGQRVLVTRAAGGEWITTLHSGASGQPLGGTLTGAYLSAISQDGSTVVSVSDGRVEVRQTDGGPTQDVATDEPDVTFPAARGEVNSLQLSSDGGVLLVTSNDQTVSLVDLATGTRIGDRLPVLAPLSVPAHLHPDGTSIALTSAAGVTVWDVRPDVLVEAACRRAGRDLTPVEWATHLAGRGEYRSTCGHGPAE